MLKLSVLAFLHVKPKGNTLEPIIPALLHVKSKKNAKTISFGVFTCKIKRKNAETNSFGVLYKYKTRASSSPAWLKPGFSWLSLARTELSQDFLWFSSFQAWLGKDLQAELNQTVVRLEPAHVEY
ncbi:unnamed protein product [Rhizophagus irregularis]|nr:unnamed protein product [Rhizophagus irregularis]